MVEENIIGAWEDLEEELFIRGYVSAKDVEEGNTETWAIIVEHTQGETD